MGHEQCLMSFFLKLLPSAAITNGDKNRTLARKLKVFPKEVNATFGILPQVQKFAKNVNLTLAIPEIVYGSHDSKGTVKSIYTVQGLRIWMGRGDIYTLIVFEKQGKRD